MPFSQAGKMQNALAESLRSVLCTVSIGPTHHQVQCDPDIFFDQQKCLLATRFKAVPCEHEK